MKSWWQRLFFPRRRSTRPHARRRLEVETLESRLAPTINIFVTGSVVAGDFFSDPARFSDGPVSPLTNIGGANYVATNLRSAVAGATAFAGDNAIYLENGSYFLNNGGPGGELDILFGPATSLLIRNAQGGTTTIDALNGSRLFDIAAGGTVLMEHLALNNGAAPTPGAGNSIGGAIVNHGTLFFASGSMVNNLAFGAGGTGNGAQGGAVYNDAGAKLFILASTLDSNVASVALTDFTALTGDAEGGAVYIAAGSGLVYVNSSTFSNNQVFGGNNESFGEETEFGVLTPSGGDAFGGAISAADTPVLVILLNSTFANSLAQGGDAAFGDAGDAMGGAIFTRAQNDFRLVNDTIAFNRLVTDVTTTGALGIAAGGGIAADPAAPNVRLVNTIIAKNSADGISNDVSGRFISFGHNLVGNVGAVTDFTGPGDQTGNAVVQLDPRFDPLGLQFNGGPTKTFALLALSTAINTADNNAATLAGLANDQRGPGFPRRVNNIVDIGAYEFQMNLDKSYTFDSSNSVSVTLTVPAPGLLLGANGVGLTAGQTYEVALEGAPPGNGTTLIVNSDGSFSFTVPAGFRNTVQFRFRLRVNSGPTTQNTNLVFTATITASPPLRSGRGSGGDYLPPPSLPPSD